MRTYWISAIAIVLSGIWGMCFYLVLDENSPLLRFVAASESIAQNLDDYMESTGHKIVRENKKSKGENNEN